jgi:hypothetical protein
VNGRPVPVTLPRARFVVDAGGHLAVTVDGRPWYPQTTTEPHAPARAGAVSLGRSDVLWARQQIANELDTPVLVEVVDDGRVYTDVVDPDSYRASDLNSSDDHPGAGTPDGPESSRESSVGAGQGGIRRVSRW